MLLLYQILKKKIDIYYFYKYIYFKRTILHKGEMMRIRFICDPSHGWGEIPLSLINELGLSKKISNYSYKKDDKAYLEEDCDLPLVLNELEKKGIQFTFTEEHSNYDSWVRNLEKFN